MADLLIGAWGKRAGELLQRSHAGTYRFGELTMLERPNVRTSRWTCWLFGEPVGRGDLRALPTGEQLLDTFAARLQQQGLAACESLGGRFALLTLDADTGACALTRDQLGEHPLVLAPFGGGYLFAEHERTLLRALPGSPEPDRLATLDWIERGTLPGTSTLYAGITRVLYGRRVILSRDGARQERWWQPSFDGTMSGTPGEVAARVREAVLSSVARASAGARRPAVKLSGGLDSACVAAGLHSCDLPKRRALALSGVFPAEPEADERDLIEATACHTHLQLHTIEHDTGRSILAPALEHIELWKLPPMTPSLFMWRPLMELASDLEVDRMLDGEGGDELFGVASFLIADMLATGRLPRAWRLAGCLPEWGRTRGARLRALRIYGVAPLVPARIKLRRQAHDGASSVGAIVPRMHALELARARIEDERERPPGPHWWKSQLEMLIDNRDRMSLGAHYRRCGVDESPPRRHPFIYDQDLIELLLRVPPSANFDPARDRAVLRDGMRGLIPETVRTRHAKSHFTSILLNAIRRDTAGLIEPLRSPHAPVRSYVDAAALDLRISALDSASAMLHTMALWRVGIANRWLIALSSTDEHAT
jgi:asparagine synthase (glutamine-hydrolysing)